MRALLTEFSAIRVFLASTRVSNVGAFETVPLDEVRRNIDLVLMSAITIYIIAVPQCRSRPVPKVTVTNGGCSHFANAMRSSFRRVIRRSEIAI